MSGTLGIRRSRRRAKRKYPVKARIAIEI